METQYAGRLEEHYEALAHHYGRSGHNDKAIDYLDKAGDKIAGYYAIQDAIEHYAGAIRRLAETDLPPDRMRQRIDINLKLAMVAYTSPSAEHFTFLEKSIEYAGILDDLNRLAHLNFWLGVKHWVSGNYESGRNFLRRTISLAENSEEELLMARAYTHLARVGYYLGELQEGISLVKKSDPRR